MIDFLGILFVIVWFVAAMYYLRRQKKAGRCVGCSGCSGQRNCSGCCTLKDGKR